MDNPFSNKPVGLLPAFKDRKEVALYKANSEPRQPLEALLAASGLKEGGRNAVVIHNGRLYGTR